MYCIFLSSFFSSPSGLPTTCMLGHLLLFPPYFLLCVLMLHICWSIFKFTDYSVSSYLLVSPFSKFFILLNVLWTSEFPFGSFLYNFYLFIDIFWWDTAIKSLFNFLNMISFNSSIIFIMTTLKSLNAKSNIWALLKVASITCSFYCVWVIFCCFFPGLIIFNLKLDVLDNTQ